MGWGCNLLHRYELGDGRLLTLYTSHGGEGGGNLVVSVIAYRRKATDRRRSILFIELAYSVDANEIAQSTEDSNRRSQYSSV